MDESPPPTIHDNTDEFRKNQLHKEKYSTLSRAFELFTDEKERLENAYDSLKEEFTSVHYELEATNKKLNRKLKELGVLTFYLESILSNLSQGILFVDLNGDVTTYNTAAQQALHVEGNSVIYTPFWHHFSDDLFGFSMREALAARSVPASSSAVIEASNEPNRYLEVNSTFVNEESKKVESNLEEIPTKKLEGVLVLFRDVTDIRSLQLIASRNDRMKELGGMAALVAHEIRNPLGGIKGFASLLRRDLQEGSRQAEMAANIIKGADDLNNFVTNVLNYSRPVAPKFEHYDVVSLLKEVKKHFDADVNRRKEKVKVKIDTSVDRLLLNIDPKIINSSLINLLYNARDAMPDGGTINLSLETFKNLAAIRVTDQGCGISQENLEKIFTPLFTTKPEGNGFGLAEVHKDIQAHFGVIEVESKVGEGTTFIITLPLIDKTEEKQKNR
ncbi:MAG: ATP-binding protein [Chlamydiota bacterium]